MSMPNCEVKLIDKNDYYKDSSFCSFSALKVFSKCETLYRDIFVTKTYEEPEQDYFIYGKLVDALVTEEDKFIQENFVRVERRIDTEDVLKFENKIKNLTKEVEEKEAQLEEKLKDKRSTIQSKIDNLKELNKDKELTPATQKKLEKLEEDLAKVEPDKVLAKGIESRKAEIEEVRKQLGQIKDLADKQQVTPSIWDNAESTALALQTHPYYSNMEFNHVTSQQIFTCEIDGIPRKGKLDHLKLSPAMTKIYAVWKAGQLTLEDFQARIRDLNENDKWAVITDIKTCYDISKLEPYNNHYRGQLRFYQDLVHHVLGIPIENIRCQILVADKLNNTFKKAELFQYTQRALDELWPDIVLWMGIWNNSRHSGAYTSAKEKAGMQQKCFTCSECRFCPFAKKAGDPVMVDAPRFGEDPAPITSDLSTADAVLEY